MRGLIVGEFYPENIEKSREPRARDNDTKVTIGTRLTLGRHKRMKVAAAKADTSLEDAYAAAVDAYLDKVLG